MGLLWKWDKETLFQCPRQHFIVLFPLSQRLHKFLRPLTTLNCLLRLTVTACFPGTGQRKVNRLMKAVVCIHKHMRPFMYSFRLFTGTLFVLCFVSVQM